MECFLQDSELTLRRCQDEKSELRGIEDEVENAHQKRRSTEYDEFTPLEGRQMMRYKKQEDSGRHLRFLL